MSYLRVLFYSCFVLLLVEVLHGQQATSNDDRKLYHCSCSIIQRHVSTRTRMGVGGADDDYTAAAVACDSLKKAVDTSDPQQIQSAATNLHSILRPILWDVGCLPRLGMAPASPQEQLAALEKKTAGLDGRALFYKLPDLAKLAFSAGDIDKAEAYSEQLLQVTPQYPKIGITETPSIMGTSYWVVLRYYEVTSCRQVNTCWRQVARQARRSSTASGPTKLWPKISSTRVSQTSCCSISLSAKASGRWTMASWINGAP